jgi:uncharacterized protein YjlB
MLFAHLKRILRLGRLRLGEAVTGSDRGARLYSECECFQIQGRWRNSQQSPLAPLVYRGAVSLPGNLDPAAVMEDLFGENGWGDSWRNGIYDYVHYHSRIHEALGIARGQGKVRFGGNKGTTVQLKAGDVAILPAGTGHQCRERGVSCRGYLPPVRHVR